MNNMFPRPRFWAEAAERIDAVREKLTLLAP